MASGIDWRVIENQGHCLAGIEEGIELLRREGSRMDLFYSASILGLLQAAQHACCNLQVGWQRCDLPLLAWAARNSVEVFIWMKFVASSEANARRFYLDWLNDAEELHQRSIQLDQVTGVDLGYSSAYPDLEFDPSLPSKAKTHIDGLRLKVQYPAGRRLEIAKVAKEVGEDRIFKDLNPILSKFIHTTAFSVVSFPSDSSRVRTALLFLDRGFWELMSVIGVADAFLKERHLPSIIELRDAAPASQEGPAGSN